MSENFDGSTSLSRPQEAVMSLNLLQLPEEILLHILSFISYHNVSEIRRVSQAFNKMCQHILTKGFTKVDRFHSSIQRHVKSQLPRRESERRTHTLARHVDILSAIETRLSLLNMTYIKYIDVGLCSFIPGKVLDELFRILRVLQESPEPPRAHEFLQELRDISSMAMEHFEEKIVPLIKQKIPSLGMPLPFTDSPSGSRTFPEFSLTTVSPRQDVVKLQLQVRSHGISLQTYRKEMADLRQRLTEQKKRLVEQEKKNSDQGRIIAEQNSRLQEQDKKIGDFSRKILEYDQKFSDIFAELAKSSSSTAAAAAPSQNTEPKNRQTRGKRTSSEEACESRSNRSCSNSRKRPTQAQMAQTNRKQIPAKRRKT